MPMGKKLGLSRQTLKWIAVVAMLIDHVGFLLSAFAPYPVWRTMRIIGRLAFPIYCFILVEGFYHTSNIKKYLIRLGVFALASEIPFDLLLRGTAFALDYQNVFFTLFIGLLLLYLYSRFLGNVQPIYALMTLISALCLGFLIQCDYGAEGVLIIFLFYFFRFRPVPMFLSVGLVMVLMGGIEPFAIASFLPIAFYNGESGWRPESERGRKLLQYGFYVFYPLHLLILGIIRILFI